MLGAGKGPGEDVTDGAGVRPVVAARKGRPREERDREKAKEERNRDEPRGLGGGAPSSFRRPVSIQRLPVLQAKGAQDSWLSAAKARPEGERSIPAWTRAQPGHSEYWTASMRRR
jgi:hypothetical protein